MVDASSRSANTAYPEDVHDLPHSPKRIRACIACRNSKIKCISVPGSSDCEACLRTSRPCQDPGPPKARVKASQKFTELEKRIDALTSALDAERRRNQQSLKHVTNEAPWSKTPDSNPKDDDVSIPAIEQTRELKDTGYGRGDTTTYDDIVDQGTANLLFDHWKFHMRPFMPVIRFRDNENAHTIRRTKPTLFLTIMTVAATAIQPSIVPHLLRKLNNTLAQDVFIHGAKSLDLLQAMILFSQFHIQPPHIKEFAMSQHAYSAVVMSYDLGLGAMKRRGEGIDIDMEETYRTLLAVYLGASCSATILRRHQPLISTSSHQDYIKALTEDGDDRDQGDLWLCSLVSLQELLDDVSKTLNTSYSRADESFEDFRTQHLLNSFRQRLNSWKLSVADGIDQRLIRHAASVADLFIHQVAIRVYNYQMLPWLRNKEENGPAQPQPTFSASHTDALCHCLKVSSDIMTIYLSLDEATARSLPNIFLVWNMCAAVCMIKLGPFAETASFYRTNGYSDRLSPENLLEAIIQKLFDISQDGYFPQSRPFLIAFKKLKLWFQQKKAICINNNGGCFNGGSGPVHYIIGTQTPPASPSARKAQIHKPSQTPVAPQYERHAAAVPEIQSAGQRNLDWNLTPYASEHTRSQVNDMALANDDYDMTYDTSQPNTDMGDFEFDFNDMLDIDKFMRTTDDDGLWSLL
ncbi:hypothetical protein GGR53DRAFT_517786 [Hypoxylon sp. FL1150]|nr:hypothetical protein GGR53DRAFT_517786 [Hypoxylon sp. FL1150]